MAAINLRRRRLNRHLRELSREVRLATEQLVQPVFVVDGLRAREPVNGLNSVWRDTPETLLKQIEADLESGITKFLLFCVPSEKHERDFNHDFAATQIQAIKARFGSDLWLAVDVCLCSHTTHGHCGVLNDTQDYVRNDATVEQLVIAANQFSAAGADCVAPSDMMDGRVAAIRSALDSHGGERTAIMSYAAKFHSSYYGPFRDAANSAPADLEALGDRSSYQLDPARPADALACAKRDADEGADILMVKPGQPYLDVLANLSREVPHTWAVYQVSGEQAAIDVLDEQGLADGKRAQLEAWTGFARAGAQVIISYAARRRLLA